MSIAVSNTDQRPRCWRCRRVLAELLTRPWELKCTRCKAANASPVLAQQPQ